MISLLLSQLEGVVSDILSCTIVLILLFLNLAILISKGILSRHPENHPQIAAFKAGESFHLMIIIPKTISSIPASSLLPPHITSSSNTFQSFLMIIIPKMISTISGCRVHGQVRRLPRSKSLSARPDQGELPGGRLRYGEYLI